MTQGAQIHTNTEIAVKKLTSKTFTTIEEMLITLSEIMNVSPAKTRKIIAEVKSSNEKNITNAITELAKLAS